MNAFIHTRRRLPVQIPADLAEVLDISPSHLSHINAGRKRLDIDKCFRLMDLVLTDGRLAGLCIHHLRPEITPGLHHFYKPAKKAWDEQRKLLKRS